jgi:hypothetical protein
MCEQSHPNHDLVETDIEGVTVRIETSAWRGVDALPWVCAVRVTGPGVSTLGRIGYSKGRTRDEAASQATEKAAARLGSVVDVLNAYRKAAGWA